MHQYVTDSHPLAAYFAADIHPLAARHAADNHPLAHPYVADNRPQEHPYVADNHLLARPFAADNLAEVELQHAQVLPRVLEQLPELQQRYWPRFLQLAQVRLLGFPPLALQVLLLPLPAA